VIKKLSQQLDGRLSSVGFPYRHVQIVDKHDHLLADRRPENALAPLVQFRHDDVLRLVGRSLSGKVQGVRPIDVLVEPVKQKVDRVRALSGSGRADEQKRFLVRDKHLHEVAVANGGDRWDDYLVVPGVLRYRRHVRQVFRPPNPLSAVFARKPELEYRVAFRKS